MLTELKRCNSIGNINGLLFLVSILSGKKKVGFNEIVNRCSHEKNITIHCSGAVSFLEYLGYIEQESGVVIVTDKLDMLQLKNGEKVIKQFVKDCIVKLTEEGLFDSDCTGFDSEKGHLSIKRSAFPLEYAAIRNFLTVAGALEK